MICGAGYFLFAHTPTSTLNLKAPAMTLRTLSATLLFLAAQTLFAQPSDRSTTIDGHRFVDLALPSGLLWAETNVGADTPADVGIYFAFGETEMKNKVSYCWDGYKFGTTEENMTKYNAKDEKATLDKEDDAATVNWGPSCRMPSCCEFRELLEPENCAWSWTTMTASSGAAVTMCKITSVRNGSSIYLPAAGWRGKGRNDGFNEEVFYWSSSADTYIVLPAFCYWIIGDEAGRNQVERCCGLPVRPVAEP